MPITYYDPNRPQQRQYEFIMQSLLNIAMQKRQLAAAKEAAEARKTHEEAMAARQNRYMEAREAKQRETESLKTAVAVGREKRLLWDKEKKEELERKRKQQVTEVMVAGRPAVIDYSGKLQFVDKTPTTAASVQEFEAWKKDNPRGTWAQFYKQKKGGEGAGGPKGRSGEAQYWAGVLGVNLKTPKGRQAVNKVMDKLYGRGNREQKLFLDAFKAVHSEFEDPEESLKKAQTLYNKVMTSETHRDFILEQEPNARYDFAQGRWYVMRNDKKEWIEVVQ